MATLIGADYSSGRPGGAALAALGVKVVGRYAATGRSSVNISAAEVKDLRAHGIDIFTYNEHSAGYMDGGAKAAQQYVPGALAVCRDAGLPDGPIFYSVDYDATRGGEPTSATALASMHALAAFLTEAARLSKSWDLVGVYGGYYVVKWLLDNLPDLNHAVQTSAWSAGHWDSRAFCRQDGYNWMINGVNCDHLTITDPDEGSLRYRRGDDMSQADVDAILAGLRQQLAALPAAVWKAPLDDDWHGTQKAAGDLVTEGHRWTVDGNYAGNRPDGSPTLAKLYLTLLRSSVSQTDTLEASAATQSKALGDAVAGISASVVAGLKDALPKSLDVDYTRVQAVVSAALDEHLGTLRIVSDAPQNASPGDGGA